MNKIIYKKADPRDFEEMLQLLRTCRLPCEDLTPSHVPYFLVAKAEGSVIGTVGLEVFGKDALLRSVAVIPEYRGKGIASRLLKHSLDAAREWGVESFHLLTMDADKYFFEKGFRHSHRELAPPSIRNTTEFANICPSSAVYMVYTKR